MDDPVVRWEVFAQHLVFTPTEALIALAALAGITAAAMIFFKRHLQLVGTFMLLAALACLAQAPAEPVLWALFCCGFFLMGYGRLTRRLWRETSTSPEADGSR